MNKMYVTCPICGAYQGKSGSGTNTETSCKKCGSELSYEVKDNTVLVQVVKASNKKRVDRTA